VSIRKYHNPNVSVIIPVYNGAAFIREALESVLAQSIQIHEIVVIDDGSIDDTAEIVASYASHGVRFIQQQRQGPSAARNRGIAETSGELIAFLDADDIWLPEKLQKQIQYLAENPQVGLVTCNMIRWDSSRSVHSLVTRHLGTPLQLQREITVRNMIGNTSHVLAKRTCIEQAGAFDPSLRWSEDWDLWIKMAYVCQIGIVQEPLVIYRWHPAGNAHTRRWERSTVIFQVARRGINRVQPLWLQPLLLLRAWSMVELQRAHYAIEHDFPKHQQISHALQSLLCSPTEQTIKKLACVAQALIGKQLYQAVFKRMKIRRDALVR
jgi:glycosyltransferase involved in cell wall biosynthesis